jgi:hypothetical protein
MDVRADDANYGRWMTHAELATSSGISTASAIKLALRHHWRKQKDNRGTSGVRRVLARLRAAWRAE